ncbi:efflux RND transporter periplasmic adaptor subunit [Massilia alkalitolerans]|jgi:membrane fusion protein, heavy metal efflux system|uniref:efflux RND transporter periplasmic adaptor subunit n=1 Tax=Massilia alkalitolerans TaxID=286638 RepID=UPI0003FA1A35|nr:efflux RND transporter periplasmic adaptor subunit [Massilia alkalitolerans]
MKFTIDKKSALSIAAVIAVGIILALLIVFWKGGSTPAQEGGEHAEETAEVKTEHGDEKEEGHAEEPGVIEMSPEQIKAAGIATATAGSAAIRTELVLPGEVRFNEDRTAHVVPRVAGVVESVAASLGQDVKKGQSLAVIASAELADLRSAALSAGKRLELARITHERERKLWEQKISAEQDYLQAQQAYREAQIESQAARAKLTALGADVSAGSVNRFVLRAPFTGVVVEKHLAQGEAVKEDANVFLVSDLSTVWVNIAVTPKDLAAVRVGQPVTVRSAAGGPSVTGKVSYVGNLLGEETRSASARVVIDNPGLAWRPGLFVNVSVVSGQKDASVAVASDAIQTLEGKTVVFMKNAKGFEARPVTTGVSDGKLTEILTGLPAGSPYVTTGSFVVKAEQGKGSAEHEH